MVRISQFKIYFSNSAYSKLFGKLAKSFNVHNIYGLYSVDWK